MFKSLTRNVILIMALQALVSLSLQQEQPKADFVGGVENIGKKLDDFLKPIIKDISRSIGIKGPGSDNETKGVTGGEISPEKVANTIKDVEVTAFWVMRLFPIVLVIVILFAVGGCVGCCYLCCWSDLFASRDLPEENMPLAPLPGNYNGPISQEVQLQSYQSQEFAEKQRENYANQYNIFDPNTALDG
jgi:hypothetical protein